MVIGTDILPDTFSIEQAADVLNWQGTLPGLSRSLQADGFEKFRASATVDGGSRLRWRRPASDASPDLAALAGPRMVEATSKPCTCRCHTGTCGANDMDLAERSLQLVERLRLSDADTITVLHDLVHRAGVNHAQAALKRIALDQDVPF